MNYVKTAMLLAGLTALFGAVGYLLGGPTGMLLALLFAGGMNLFAYWNSDRLALSAHGAQEVDEASAPDLVRMVRDLAQRAGLPMPRVYLMDNPQPNAFATGRNPQNAAVAVTTGLMHILSREELAGVDGARARAHQEPRHADHDGDGHHRRRHLVASPSSACSSAATATATTGSAPSARSRWPSWRPSPP